MARRINKGVSPILIIGIVLLLLVAVGGGYFMMTRGSQAFASVPGLDLDDYMENGNSLRGNTYKVQGEVGKQISWSAQRGRLYSFEVENDMGREIVPILIPSEFNHLNLGKGLVFQLKVSVENNGVLVAQAVEKA